MSDRMSDVRLQAAREILERHHSFLSQNPAPIEPRIIWYRIAREFLEEVDRLRAYEADAADRFAAVVRQRDAAEEDVRRLTAAIKKHHDQKADDRCWMDDQELYAGVGLTGDNCVGATEAMLANCKRFIERRCQGGKWPTYAELEAKLLGVCKAAIRYDESICGRAARGEVDLREAGGAISTGDDLDALYEDWISKARAAIRTVE